MNQEIISDKLDIIGRNIELIKEHLEDTMLTRDDIDSIKEAEDNLDKGKTVRLE